MLRGSLSSPAGTDGSGPGSAVSPPPPSSGGPPRPRPGPVRAGSLEMVEQTGARRQLKAKKSDAVGVSASKARLSSIMALRGAAYLLASTKEVVFGSRLNVLMLLTPFAAVAAHSGWGDGAVFLIALLAIAPFAERLGFVTEQLAMHTNDTLGGLLNATFGNATELIISLFALLKGRNRPENATPELYRSLVQLSLLGSILSNLLLVFGSALICGGLRHKEQTFNKLGGSVSTALLLLGATAIAAPAVLDATGHISADKELAFSRVLSVLLASVYFLFLYFQLRTHRSYYEDDVEDGSDGNGDGYGDGHIGVAAHEMNGVSADCNGDEDVNTDGEDDDDDDDDDDVVVNLLLSPGHGGDAEDNDHDHDDDDDEEVTLGFWTAIAWLAIISIVISGLSEYLVAAVKGAAVAWGIPDAFLSAILIALVGNAAEHASALVFAYRNKMDIVLGIAVGSAVQIGVSVLPVCVLLGWAVGTPLDLRFGAFEVCSLLLSILLVGVVIQGGKSNWLYGVILVTAYFVIAAGFWFST